MNWGKVLPMLALVFLVGCVVVEKECVVPEPVEKVGGVHDLLEKDVLALFDTKSINSSQVSVKGVMLGDSFVTVTQQFGVPDVIEEYYDEGIVNARYDDLEANKTKIIFHLKDDKVERMTIREGLDPQLIGKSKIDYTLAEITSTFGKPDFSEDLSFTRVYWYEDLGLEIYHRRKQMQSYAFVSPQ